MPFSRMEDKTSFKLNLIYWLLIVVGYGIIFGIQYLYDKPLFDWSGRYIPEL